MAFGVKTMSVSPAFMPDATHPAPEPFGYRPLAAIAAAAAGGVPQKRIGRVLSEVAPELIVLHGQNKVHGAISVHTVGLDEFGYAHLLVPALYPDHAGAMEPASCFVAVEQFDPDPVQACGPWTDVYALCAVMCSLVSGSSPPHALARRAQDSYVSLAMRKPRGYDEAFLAAIDQGLSLAPAQRQQSIQALCEMLGIPYLPETNEIPPEVHHSTMPSGVGHGLAHKDRTGDWRRRVVSMLAVAAGVLAAVGAWVWFGQHHTLKERSFNPVVVASHSAAGRTTPPPYAYGTPVSPFVADLNAMGPNAANSRRSTGETPAREQDQPAPPPSALAPSQPALTGSLSPLTPPSTPLAALSSVPQPATAAPQESSSATPNTSSAAVTPVPAPRSARVMVKVDVRPWGEIIIDGVSRGVSPPLKTLYLPAGRHTVEIRNANLSPYRASLDLKSGQPVTLRHVFP